MQLTFEQTKALDALNHWLTVTERGEEIFVLAGYAGTGKTTLLQHFINLQDKPILCCAPTGKAASVLQKKLSNNTKVTTIHKLLYNPSAASTANLEALRAELEESPESETLKIAIDEELARLADQKLNFRLKDDLSIEPGQIIVVDEASMVTKRMQKDLLDTRAKVIYVGDPGQLPPVNDAGFFIDYKPDAMLTEVQRQALENPIIRASMRVRNGESIAPCNEGAFRKMPKESLPGPQWLTYDQVITGANESRRRVNRYFRKQLGRVSWYPETDDKLICLKNEKENPFINGIPATAVNRVAFQNFGYYGDILYEGQVFKDIEFYEYPFKIHYDLTATELPWHGRHGISEFDYAYAVTVHKSQGSEWNRVLLADDQMNVNQKNFRKQWLYTAITRAKEELLWLF